MTPADKPGRATVMQFAKWPEPGRVKTRLMPLLGEQGALEAHVELTLAVMANLTACGHEFQFWWDRPAPGDDAPAGPVLDAIRQAGASQQVQQGASLGQRMTAALTRSLESADRAIVVGSDCPAVTPDYVRQALTALEEVDVVLGPSNDGGYVLIGARRTVPDMLAGIDWGTGQVLDQTRARLAGLGLSVRLLAPSWDVDEPEDWLRYRKTLR